MSVQFKVLDIKLSVPCSVLSIEVKVRSVQCSMLSIEMTKRGYKTKIIDSFLGGLRVLQASRPHSGGWRLFQTDAQNAGAAPGFSQQGEGRGENP